MLQDANFAASHAGAPHLFPGSMGSMRSGEGSEALESPHSVRKPPTGKQIKYVIKIDIYVTNKRKV